MNNAREALLHNASSPMLEQYWHIKKEQEGNVLFFRLGDFYEMFAEDAVEVSALLNLTLTSRNGLPMCGVPYHAARSYIARLLRLGKKIAVCEQLTAPEKGVKVIERAVVEIITPGTTVDEEFLDKGSSNYIACLARFMDSALSFSYIDLSTGEFYSTSLKNNAASRAGEALRQELERLQIKELLIQESLLEEDQLIAAAVYERSNSGSFIGGSLVLNRWADWLFDYSQAKSRLEKQFGITNLKSLGIEENGAEIISAGTLLNYLDSTSQKMLSHIRTIKIYSEREFLGIDESSQRNLELICNQRDSDVRFSLLEVMDETRCSMGRRLLKRRILHPLCDINLINNRLNMVEYLYRDQGKLSKLRELLGKMPDLERLCSRLAMDKAHGRDLLAVKNSIFSFFEIENIFHNNSKNQNEILFEGEKIDDSEFAKLVKIKELLDKGICEEPSIVFNEGNLIKEGFNEQLDSLRLMKENSRQVLDNYLEEEKKQTGITSLKIRYNRLIGYFFEVTKNNIDKVPKYFIRRQGIVTGERYTTDTLASLESEINGASDKITDLEKKLFLEIREEAKKLLNILSAAARKIAEIDVSQSLAKASSIRGWNRPQLVESGELEIIEGRHPVVEAHLNRGDYMPNDIQLDTAENKISFAMITGPNMAGKSTYLRSAALIVIMAQAGSFVPAAQARIGICDRIYCRVGASDNLARGESTFLVEMNETAFILNTATNKSLVIMDEVGRGTGTNDGLSIAWAVSEELLNKIGCRTLFATHFHELSLLSHSKLANRSMEVLDQGEKIIFLRKLKEGPAEESYGIHVAKLAGLSHNVLQRADEIMRMLRERDRELELSFFGKKITVNNSGKTLSEIKKNEESFTDKLLKEIDPEKMTPLEALNILCQWKKMQQSGLTKGLERKLKTDCEIKKEDKNLSLFD